MASDNQPTCGQGLAANADLPARLGELLATRADVLERHMRALDPADPAARPELDAYAALAGAHRAIAAQLSQLADQMASYKGLPMAAHDMQVMTDPRGQAEAFQRFIALERELVSSLQSSLPP